MDIKIRDYEQSDYKGLISLLSEVYGSKIEQPILESVYITSSRSIIVALDESENVVGCTFVEIQEDFVRPSRIAYVTYVAVDERFRKQGIGRKLLLAVEDICKRCNCSAIELTSANFRIGAHAFYESLGYSKKKTTVFIKEMGF